VNRVGPVRLLGGAIVAAAVVLPHALAAGTGQPQLARATAAATAAAQHRADDRHACEVRYRRVLPAAAAAMATQAVLAACGTGHVAAMRPWLSPVPYFPPREPAAARPAARPGAPALERASAPAPERAPARRAPAASGSGAPSDAEVAAELREAFKGGGSDGVDSASLTANGLATVPVTAPARVASIIQAGNQVAYKPYVYGGGHGGGPEGTFTDSAYDCSGSVSYTLAAAGLVKEPMVSGALARWGAPGPGRWVTIYANGGHAFMVVAGLRFDTSGRAADGSRWQAAARSVAGFAVRHPPGL
jgi:hypothetical protein